MATLPEVIGFDTDIVIASQPSYTWIINRNTMQVSGMDEGLEAVRQAVEIMLYTERFKWQIYSTNFGSEIDTLIGDDYAYIISELPRMVTEALSVDSRVVSVEEWSFERAGTSLSVSFTVHTVFGDLAEVITI